MLHFSFSLRGETLTILSDQFLVHRLDGTMQPNGP